MLTKILKVASQNGDSPEQTLEAVSKPATAKELAKKTEELAQSCSRLTTQHEKLTVDYSHRQNIIKIVDALVFKHGFSEQAIEDVLDAAKLYGDPQTVLRAIQKYGKILALDESTGKKESYLKAKEEQIRAIDGRYAASLQHLEVLPQKVQEILVHGMANADAVATEIAEKIGKSIENYAATVAQATNNEEERKMTIIIRMVDLFPSNVVDFKPRYGIKFIETGYKFFEAKGANPVLNLDEAILQKYPNLRLCPGLRSLDLLRCIRNSYEDYATNNGGV